MIRIAGLHVIDPVRGRKRTNLNREWVELYNSGPGSVDVFGYVVASSCGEKTALEPSGRTSLILPMNQAILIFSGRPDDASSPPGCFMELECERFFLCRTRPLFNDERDAAFLYPSMADYLSDPASYLDVLHFSRHCQAKAIMGV